MVVHIVYLLNVKMGYVQKIQWLVIKLFKLYLVLFVDKICIFVKMDLVLVYKVIVMLQVDVHKMHHKNVLQDYV